MGRTNAIKRSSRYQGYINHLGNPILKSLRNFMLKNTVSKIPMGEALDDWIEVMDPVTKKKVYSKIPMGETESSYMDTVRKALRSNNPYRRIEIITARVYVEEENCINIIIIIFIFTIRSF